MSDIDGGARGTFDAVDLYGQDGILSASLGGRPILVSRRAAPGAQCRGPLAPFPMGNEWEKDLEKVS